MGLNRRHFRHSTAQPMHGFVTANEALLPAGQTQAFISNTAILDSTIGVFRRTANGLWNSVVTDLGNVGTEFEIVQKQGQVTANGVDQFTADKTAILTADRNHLRVTKKAHVPGQVKEITLSNYPVAPEGGSYIVSIHDLSKLTGTQNPVYTFTIDLTPAQAAAATVQTDISTRLAALINNKKHNAYHAWDTNLYSASVVGATLEIQSVYKDEAFTVAVSGQGAGTTIATTQALVLSSGTYEEVRDMERDLKAHKGYTFQNQVSPFFPNDYAAVPNFFAEPGCTYTLYNIHAKLKRFSNNERPRVTNNWEYQFTIAVKESTAGTAETTFDTVFASVGVTTL